MIIRPLCRLTGGFRTIPRSTLLLLVLLVCAPNTVSGATNPAGDHPPENATVNQKKTTAKTEERKLSRKERRERLKKLPDRYHDFLNNVEPIITPEEVTAFLLLDTDAQRDYFIERFWMIRDSDPGTPRNEFRDQYEELLLEAKEMFRYVTSDRARVYLTQGRPADRVRIDCSRYVVPIEIWVYPYIKGLGNDVLLIFYQPRLGGDYRLWRPIWGMRGEALQELLTVEGEQRGAGAVFFGGGGLNAVNPLKFECKNGDLLLAAVGWGLSQNFEMETVFEPPEIDPEHVGRTLRNTVVANPDAPKLPAEIEVSFPGTRGTRTAVRMSMAVPASELVAKEIDGTSFYNVDVTGEVLKDEAFFDNYRYRYNFPVDVVGDSIPVVVDRYLRPNHYVSRIKIVDANSGAEAILEEELDVPKVDAREELTAEELESSDTIESIRQDYFLGESRLRIVPLPEGILTGYQTIETLVTGEEIDHVEFYVDGEKIMTKHEPPYSLELDLGIVPSTRKLRAVGRNHEGKLVAGDEIVINTGTDPFRVHIAHPRIAPRVEGQTRVEVEVDVPEGKTLDRIDLYLNEDLVGTMYDRPFVQTIWVPSNLDVGYLRAVAVTAGDDPLETEDVVFINSPQFIQEVDVHLVELPTTVLRNGRPVQDLPRSAFRVFDGDSEVEIAKFEYVRDIPLFVGLAVDSSGSMEDKIVRAQRAAAQFFRDILRPGDRAFVISFAQAPVIVQKWTDQREDLVRGLAGLRAEDATALYDSIVYSLYNFQGIDGQKALVILSDGKDTTSKFTFEQALEYARRSAVPVYSIGLGIPVLERDTRSKLARISSETGGRSYFIESIEGIDAIYDEIETELRAQYLLGFYPSESVARGSDWREIRVSVDQGEARTIRGYYP